jgi:outer membrane protein assembly factor BamB
LLVLVGFGLASLSLLKWREYAGPTPEAPDEQENLAELERLKTATLSSSKEPVVPGEWPQWRGPRRDGISSETGLRTDWAKAPPTVVWKRPLGGGYSSIAVIDNRLYTMDRQGNEERILCLDAKTGNELWVHRYTANYGNLSYGNGPRATPTISDGRVYTVGATGIFLCMEAAPSDGQPHELWKHDLMKEFGAQMPGWGVACSPLVDGDLVWVQPGGPSASVAAFDRRTGKVVHRALSEPSGYSSPVAATAAGVHQIVCCTGQAAVGLDPTNGKQLWYFPWPTPNGIIATPIVASDYVFVSSAYNTGCALVHLKSEGHGAIAAEPVYVKRNKLMRNHHASSVLHEGYLYGFDDAILKCVDLRRGKEKWSSRDVGKGCLLFADGHLIVLSENGTLTLAEASPAGYREKGRMAGVLTGADCWALPALAGGQLYLRDHKQLVCLDLMK